MVNSSSPRTYGAIDSSAVQTGIETQTPEDPSDALDPFDSHIERNDEGGVRAAHQNTHKTQARGRETSTRANHPMVLGHFFVGETAVPGPVQRSIR
jgi:hypothetical protein